MKNLGIALLLLTGFLPGAFGAEPNDARELLDTSVLSFDSCAVSFGASNAEIITCKFATDVPAIVLASCQEGTCDTFTDVALGEIGTAKGGTDLHETLGWDPTPDAGTGVVNFCCRADVMVANPGGSPAYVSVRHLKVQNSATFTLSSTGSFTVSSLDVEATQDVVDTTTLEASTGAVVVTADYCTTTPPQAATFKTGDLVQICLTGASGVTINNVVSFQIVNANGEVVFRFVTGSVANSAYAEHDCTGGIDTCTISFIVPEAAVDAGTGTSAQVLSMTGTISGAGRRRELQGLRSNMVGDSSRYLEEEALIGEESSDFKLPLNLVDADAFESSSKRVVAAVAVLFSSLASSAFLLF